MTFQEIADFCWGVSTGRRPVSRLASTCASSDRLGPSGGRASSARGTAVAPSLSHLHGPALECASATERGVDFICRLVRGPSAVRRQRRTAAETLFASRALRRSRSLHQHHALRRRRARGPAGPGGRPRGRPARPHGVPLRRAQPQHHVQGHGGGAGGPRPRGGHVQPVPAQQAARQLHGHQHGERRVPGGVGGLRQADARHGGRARPGALHVHQGHPRDGRRPPVPPGLLHAGAAEGPGRRLRSLRRGVHRGLRVGLLGSHPPRAAATRHQPGVRTRLALDPRAHGLRRQPLLHHQRLHHVQGPHVLLGPPAQHRLRHVHQLLLPKQAPGRLRRGGARVLRRQCPSAARAGQEHQPAAAQPAREHQRGEAHAPQHRARRRPAHRASARHPGRRPTVLDGRRGARRHLLLAGLHAQGRQHAHPDARHPGGDVPAHPAARRLEVRGGHPQPAGQRQDLQVAAPDGHPHPPQDGALHHPRRPDGHAGVAALRSAYDGHPPVRGPGRQHGHVPRPGHRREHRPLQHGRRHHRGHHQEAAGRRRVLEAGARDERRLQGQAAAGRGPGSVVDRVRGAPPRRAPPATQQRAPAPLPVPAAGRHRLPGALLRRGRHPRVGRPGGGGQAAVTRRRQHQGQEGLARRGRANLNELRMQAASDGLSLSRPHL